MAQHSEPIPGGISDPMSPAGDTVAQGPGWFTFAAVIMFFVAGFEVLSALLAFGGTGWWATETGNLVYANFVFWGVLDLIVALIAFYAGISLLRGGRMVWSWVTSSPASPRSDGSSSSRRPRYFPWS
jgi:hypothetical protein